jgi:tetratricopeptide (TPR) repeat protein
MKYCLILFALLFLHGCAQLGQFTSGSTRIEQLDQYLAEQEFSKALVLIADTPKEDPQILEIAKRHKKILDQIHSFEQKSIAQALKLEKKNDWPGAKLTYEEALDKLNISNALVREQKAMLTRFQARMDALELEELIVTGEWFRKKMPLLQSLQESDPGDLVIQWRYSRTENEAREIALKLLRSGEQMLAENNLAMAQRILPLAVELSPGPDTENAAKLLDNKLKARKYKKQKNRSKIAQKRDEKEIEEFNKAMALGELAEARRHLNRLTPGRKNSVAVELMQERLDKAIAEYIKEELSIGDSFYRAGEYSQAIETWNNAITLDPDNKIAQSKIRRAETIVKNLELLRERQDK